MVVFKRLRICNVDSKATANDLSELFGLRKTTYLQRNCCIEIKPPEDGKIHAIAVLPQQVYDELITLNGIDFYEKKLEITDADYADEAGEGDAQSSTNPSSRNEEEEDEILYMQLDCRNHPDLNFPPVRVVEICDALMTDHQDDPHKAVKALWGRYLGVFCIESKDMNRYVDKSLIVRGHEIKLSPIRKQQRQRTLRDPEGIKIRIFDAYGLKFRGIDNDAFNEYFQNLGVEVIKQTQPERCRDRPDVFNTNRFIVVKKKNDKGETIDFGTKIFVAGFYFNLSYWNIQKFCALCMKKHG